MAAIKNIIETTFRPTARATRPRVDWSSRFGRVQATIRYDLAGVGEKPHRKARWRTRQSSDHDAAPLRRYVQPIGDHEQKH